MFSETLMGRGPQYLPIAMVIQNNMSHVIEDNITMVFLTDKIHHDD